MPPLERSPKRRLSVVERRARKYATLRVFIHQYGRKAQKSTEPNDRRYDRRVEAAVKRMDPLKLDLLLRDDED